jgi:hypothetical protein
VDHVPLGGGESISQVEVEGHPFDQTTSFESRLVTPRYFAAMGIPLVEGRDFDDGDAPVLRRDRGCLLFAGEARNARGSGDFTALRMTA